MKGPAELTEVIDTRFGDLAVLEVMNLIRA